eukprot:TRINITY_DN26884_c0_g1_i4.p1 TRINITY_DN26884_c0_g1~~TRINITY_DN26884_c0_g1_i4.p1  ORF type:complete len:207 (+),score=6.62 TRINITY_DN26884_c0_g1_i4:56-676(+)
MTVSEFRPGDHLYRRRYLYDHHLVFVGWVDREAGLADVIHNSGGMRSGRGAKTKRDVKDVRQYKLAQHSPDVQATLDRAFSKVGETGYDLVFKNCEHFAEWCLTGRARSHQVRGACFGVPQAALLGAAIGAAMAPAATLFGNERLGQWAVELGIIQAPPKWPRIAAGSLISAPVGALAGLFVARHCGRFAFLVRSQSHPKSHPNPP